MSSRRGQQIASKACDGCRDRKIKCTWTESTPCNGCVSAGICCTFQTTRKRRGRPQRYLEKFGPDNAEPFVPVPSKAASSVTNEDLCSISTFHLIIEDFLENVYPIAPLVHIPSLKAQISDQIYLKDANFLRLCLSICAMKISSLPRKAEIYCLEHYQNSKDIVTRAYQLEMTSRLVTSPAWAEIPTSNDLICSLLLGMASHYTQCPRRGWVLINESIHCCRSLGLHHEEGYRGMSILKVEINKRAFWMLYIIQIHDRMSHKEPFTLLGESPCSTDWDFIIPLSLSDEELSGIPKPSFVPEPPPIIIGFVILIKVFRCVLGLLSIPPSNITPIHIMPQHTPFLSPSSLLQTFKALSSVLDDIPPELNILQPTSPPPSLPTPQMNPTTTRRHHFETMKSNIYITKLYLQSWTLDRYLSLLPPSPLPQSPTSTLTEQQ